MKKTVKAGVLTGLILAPGAVVSANETDTTQFEPIAAVETGTVDVSSNAVEGFDEKIRQERLKEIYELDGTSEITDFQPYYDLIDDLLKNENKTEVLSRYENDYQLLTKKIDFLKKLEDLKDDAASLSSEISLLKNTNPNLFSVVPLLDEKYKELRSEFLEARSTLDKFVEVPLTYGLGNGLETIALSEVDSYFKTIEGFEGQALKNASTLKSYIKDIKKPHVFIYGREITGLETSDDTANVETSDDTSTIEVPAYVEKLAAMDELNIVDSDPGSNPNPVSDSNTPSNFRELYENATKFYADKLNATEKKIADSHVLEDDGRTVATILKAAKDDITKADKVNALIAEIKVINEKDFKKKVETVIKEYDNLNLRQRALIVDYDSTVLGTNDTDGTKNNYGYKDALDVYNTINSLKNRKNTQEYRELAKDTNTSYGLLGDLKRYVSNYDILKAIIDDLGVVEKIVDDIEDTGIENLITRIDSIEKIKAARALYDSLPKEQQKLVINYKELQNFEKSGKTTIKLSDQIDAVEIVKTKAFASKVDALNKTFDKLSEKEQVLVKSLDRLTYLTPFATITGKYYSLKTTSANYQKDVLDLYIVLTATTGELETIIGDAKTTTEDKIALRKLKDDLKTDVTKLKDQLDSAATVIQNIEAAQDGEDKVKQLEAIQTARNAYNALQSKEVQKLVTNLKTLTELEKVVKQPLAVTKTIEAVDPENTKKFPSAAKSAVTAFEKLTEAQKSYLSDDNKKRIEDFKTYLAFVDQMKALKPNTAGFQTAYNAIKEKFDKLIEHPNLNNLWKSELETKIIDAIKAYGTDLEKQLESISGWEAVYNEINVLGLKSGQTFLEAITAIDTAYAELPSNAKKQVTNYKQFQQLKKDSAAALKVVDLINDDTIKTRNVAASGYVKKVESAVKAYEKLTSRQKGYVYNYLAYLEPNLPIYEIAKAINNLKPSAKTYIEDVANVRQMYDRLTPEDQSYLEPILYKIEGAETGLVTVNEVMGLIDEARPGVENYVQKLAAAREAYDKLARINSGYQKLVLNYKTLTNREKELKPVTTAIYQIKELEEILARQVIDSNELVKKYNNAVKAYEKIPYESRELVYNRDVLFETLYPVSKTTEAIANIKPSSKTFTEDVKKARDWYNSLSTEDKARVSNYNDLIAFENTVSGGSDVDGLIRQIPSTLPTQYMQALKEARAAYNALTANEKRAVTLYKELQNYEKGVKNVQATIDAIDDLQYASNLVSAYDKATKALDKLTAKQREMVPNMDKLRSVGPAIDIYKMIASLKPSNANYAGTVQAAYSAYNRLSSAEKQYVTNFATLQEAKNNVDSVQAVISKIAGISTTTSRNYAQQVAEALAMYNSLPSAVRKLVTNYDSLKSSQKEVDKAGKVRQLISEINPNARNFASKVKSARSAYDKLTLEQKYLVSNYPLLEDYESELNEYTFFF